LSCDSSLDYSNVDQRKLIGQFIELFQKADLDHSGSLSYAEFKEFVQKHTVEFPQLGIYADHIKELFLESDVNHDGLVSVEEFKQLLIKADQFLTALPATAQVANQQGKYLGEIFNRAVKNKEIAPFKYQHLGSFAYVGGNSAIAQLPLGVEISGLVTWWLWRGAYLSNQVSYRNSILIAFDWMKAAVFGRDISRV